MQTRRNRNTKKAGYVYILSNKSRNVLYIGVTSKLESCIWQHRNGEGCKFTTKYRTKYLIYYEQFETIVKAIEREKQLKNWHRSWKLNLIRKFNPELHDLWPDL